MAQLNSEEHRHMKRGSLCALGSPVHAPEVLEHASMREEQLCEHETISGMTVAPRLVEDGGERKSASGHANLKPLQGSSASRNAYLSPSFQHRVLGPTRTPRSRWR
eukprot:scaffold1499_cov255-Pinguiococcus_pyrenoidosus.AAC.22